MFQLLQVDKQPTSCERGIILLLSSIPSIDCINFVLQFFCLVNESNLFFQVVGILFVLNPTALPLQKLCVKCHALDTIVSTTNDDVNCNVCHGKTTIKKARYLCASIATTEDPIILTIEGKWIKGVVHMLETNFLILPHPKEVQLFIKKKLLGKLLLSLIFQLMGFEEHIEEMPLQPGSSTSLATNFFVHLNFVASFLPNFLFHPHQIFMLMWSLVTKNGSLNLVAKNLTQR